MKKIFLMFFLFFLLVNNTFAITFWWVKNILQNTKTWEIKYVEDLSPWWDVDLFQDKINSKVYHNTVWDEIFENWKIICIYDDFSDRIKKVWDCKYLDENIKNITINDLSFKDKSEIYSGILSEYLFYLILWLPFNFFVFFWISYVFFWTKRSLSFHFFITIILTIILDITLYFYKFSFIQLSHILFWPIIYFMFVLWPKLIFALHWLYTFYRYKKLKNNIKDI